MMSVTVSQARNQSMSPKVLLQHCIDCLALPLNVKVRRTCERRVSESYAGPRLFQYPGFPEENKRKNKRIK